MARGGAWLGERIAADARVRHVFDGGEPTDVGRSFSFMNDFRYG